MLSTTIHNGIINIKTSKTITKEKNKLEQKEKKLKYKYLKVMKLIEKTLLLSVSNSNL